MTLDDGSAVWIRGRLLQVRATSRFRRLSGTIQREVADAETSDALRAILLVEMSARPTFVRALEWIAGWTTCGRLAATRGPLQLRDAPFDFRAAVHQAAVIVGQTDDDAHLAVLWNGSVTRDPGSRVSYTTALLQARDLLGEHR